MGIYIDNKFYKYFNNKFTILQFCLSVSIYVPFFCYHELLSIAGNCRMCLVEVNNVLVASCAINISDNMIINTNNNRVRLARESVLEFLLVNHPLDCPVCDEGGECDLQDIALTYGSDIGHFHKSYKRSVDNLNCCGPLIKTIMTRCIHCTRCVRFVSEISDNFDLGVIGRGNSMEIGTYIEKYVSDELIGNIIDLCPVGALTSMPFSFTTRAWELLNIRSIDILDSLCSSIRIDVHNNKIMRVLPSLDGFINEEWITNKTRFSYDSLNIQRLNFPRISYYNKFIAISWGLALYCYIKILCRHKFHYIQVICGPFIDLESSWSLKEFFNSFGCANINYFENSSFYFICDFRIFYLLNKTLIELENLNSIIFIGTNLRMELPLVNLKIRKNYIENEYFNSFSFGLSLNYLTFPVKNLGNSIYSLIKFLEGKFYLNFIVFLYNFYNVNFYNVNYIKNINFFIGMSVLNRIDSNSILFGFLNLFNKFKLYDYSNLNLISKFLGRISSFEIGILQGLNSNMLNQKIYKKAINHYCGIDLDVSKIYNLSKENINIYQGSFYLNFFMIYIWLILPTTLYHEDYLGYINLEGRYRLSQKAVSTTTNIKNDGLIFNLLLKLKFKIINNNFSIINNFYTYLNYFKNIINFFDFRLNKFFINYFISLENINVNFKINILMLFNFKLINNILVKTLYNSYFADPITKNSKILNKININVLLSNWNKRIKTV